MDGLEELRARLIRRFTENMGAAMLLAQEESRRLGHNYVGTEMLFRFLFYECPVRLDLPFL